jgi:hypothetical protein
MTSPGKFEIESWGRRIDNPKLGRRHPGDTWIVFIAECRAQVQPVDEEIA